ncbi:hypothetical protein JTB14_033155 [Gonioctena quinquepunctata]|nr:hypothetical protein JTB14_033155 [Gonioctena quinquepunctata]
MSSGFLWTLSDSLHRAFDLRRWCGGMMLLKLLLKPVEESWFDGSTYDSHGLSPLVDKTNPIMKGSNVSADALQDVPLNSGIMLFLVFSFATTRNRCLLNDSERSGANTDAWGSPSLAYFNSHVDSESRVEWKNYKRPSLALNVVPLGIALRGASLWITPRKTEEKIPYHDFVERLYF